MNEPTIEGVIAEMSVEIDLKNTPMGGVIWRWREQLRAIAAKHEQEREVLEECVKALELTPGWIDPVLGSYELTQIDHALQKARELGIGGEATQA